MDALRRYNQFLPVRIVPRANGKSDKIPVNPAGDAVDPHNPAHWYSFADAQAHAVALGGSSGVGFVLTADDPFFCVDLDSCLLPDRSGWSKVASDLVAAIPGALVEVSQSLTGLHIWGSARSIPPHKCKNTALGLELYHEKRFILMGINQVGDAGLDCSAVLPQVIHRYFPPDASTPATGAPEWTSEAVPAWSGPEDDDALLTQMLASNSAANVFGATVSFRDLWEANTDVLGATWPSDGREYDASSADAALAQRLAFWTGKNCERIQRLMLRSALVRDKYDRPDYLRRTILGACARQAQVYSKPTVAQREQTLGQRGWISQSDLPALFKGYTYVEDQDRVLDPEGEMLGQQAFRTRFGGRVWVLDEQKNTRNAWEAFTQTAYYEPPIAHSTCFRPDLEPGAMIRQEGRLLVNAWMPITTASKPGDVTPFLNHLALLYPNANDREYLLCYLAAMVQYPGRKFQWAPLLQGCEGNGKTLLVKAAMRAVGERYSHIVDAQDLGGNGGKFNAWLANKLLICVEEVYTSDKREVLEILKPMITNDRIQLQGKGKDQYTGDNRANFIFTSNYPDAITLNENSRRYGIFLSAHQSKADLDRDGMGNAYFVKLWDWFEGRAGNPPGWQFISHFLKTYPIPAERNPALLLQRPPVTTTTAVAIEAGLGRVEQEILEAVDQEIPGFAGGWVSSVMLTGLLERKRLAGRVPLNRYGALLHALGYIPHPSLPRGRTGRIVAPDGVRTRLYVKRGSLLLQLTDPDRIAARYSDDQRGLTTGAALRA